MAFVRCSSIRCLRRPYGLVHTRAALQTLAAVQHVSDKSDGLNPASTNNDATKEPPGPAPPSFVPRTSFPALDNLPRSYFLGHHKAGLQKMKTLLSTIDLVIECRDYRVPLTSRNPLFEKSLEGKERIIVYTKRDLGGPIAKKGEVLESEEIIRKWHAPLPVMFTSAIARGKGMAMGKKSVKELLDVVKGHAEQRWKLVGHRLMVVGMPNVGKSTLLNALRGVGVGKGKVAKTGMQPGVTRKVGSGVKIVASEDDDTEISTEQDGDDGEAEGQKKGVRRGGDAKYKGVGGGVYMLDTPGVFIPYVPDAEAMLKLALCGSVKDTIIPPVLLADYLLYHINLRFPSPRSSPYSLYCAPTNDIVVLLEAIAKKTGRLGKGGKADTEATALWMVQKWRTGHLGRFLLDAISEDALEKSVQGEEGMVPSFNQARRAETERRRERGRMRGLKS
ncbi:P-loop containing nucleoside triphosphate hydrolase protein [Amniculicola lignicola CBS 123094]|uniref:P-loop containing nucleoside triphosphate hydrolase protein n=1 Tax=Amniculicola lignicola CBS 123094 TaxID=1392246 RepID=A0A6A5WJH3_9PLEO|nr:P-loop containing nucleoside triphosphate hydrolase protein [Amniculicola lignicola CBS 123094]